MAVRLKYGDVSYIAQPDARGLDLSSFRETGQAIVATAANLQERAVRNENAYNEMAIKMSEYNAIQGVDEEALATKINETQATIKEKVDSDGGWFFADTAVTDGARKFLTDEGTKTILSNKAMFDQIQTKNNESDAPEEYKKAQMAMVLDNFNSAGGSLGGNGKQSISSFGGALGKGHDRSVYQKELLEMMKAWKADKRYVFEGSMATDLTNFYNSGQGNERTRQIAAQIIAARGGNLEGFISRDKTIESVSEDEIREVFMGILSNKPEFRTALANEANLNLWMANKSGKTNSQIVTSELVNGVVSDPKMQQTILINSDFSKLSDSEKAIALQSPIALGKYLEQGIQKSFPLIQQQEGEDDASYQQRMAGVYSSTYAKQNIDSLLSMAKIGAYTAVDGKTKSQWFSDILLENLKSAKKKAEESSLPGKIGYSQGNMSSLAASNIADSNIKITEDRIATARATVAALENGGDPITLQYAKNDLEQALQDKDNLIRNQQSLFTQLDYENPEHLTKIREAKRNLINQYVGPNKKELEKELNGKDNVNDIIDTFLKYDDGRFEYNTVGNVLGKTVLNLMGVQNDVYENISDPVDRERLYKYFAEPVSELGIVPKSKPFTVFTPLSENKNAFNQSLEGAINQVLGNAGSWNIYSSAINDKNGTKYNEKLNGMPITMNETIQSLVGARKSGQDGNAIWQPTYKNASIIADDEGKLYLKLVIPPQGDNKYQQELIIGSDDAGNNTVLRDIMYNGLQASYNEVITNPTNELARSAFNELSTYSGLTTQLGANYANPQQFANPQNYNYNTVNGIKVNNLSNAISIIVKDREIGDNDKNYPLYVTSPDGAGYKVEITKTRSGNYTVSTSIADNDNGTITYVPSSVKDYTYSNDIAFKNGLADIVNKLTNTSKYMQNFQPINSGTKANPYTYSSNPMLLNLKPQAIPAKQ